jgi:hypothetical protein
MMDRDNRTTSKSENSTPSWVSAAGIIVVPIVVALVTTVVAQYFTASQKARDQDIRMVEIALSLVTPDPEKGGAKGARQFAVDLLEKYSGVPISKEERDTIINTAVVQTPPATAVPAQDRPIGSDEVVLLDEPGHTLQWTGSDGAAIDFNRPVTAPLIKAKTPSLKILAGNLPIADRYVRSTSDTSDPAQFNAAILNYLKSNPIGTIPSGTCLKLINLYIEQIDGIRVGKAVDTACPDAGH